MVHLSVGKLAVAAVASVLPAARVSRRLFVNNVHTGKRFLVDSGAEISVMPPIGNTRHASDIVLIAVNGTKITTYGSKTIHLDLGFQRKFTWSFKVADVSKSIFGADFLYYFGLLIDIRRKRLIDCVDQISVNSFSIARVPIYTILFMSQSLKCTAILQNFSKNTRKSPVSEKFLHNVVHELQTTGRSLFTHPHRLPPEKCQISHREFDYMRQKGICRPSSSSWASPLLLIAKRDGNYRPCSDYRRLNEVTRPYRYPLPHLHDFTSNMVSRTFFTELDLVRAYHQIQIAVADVPKIAVITPFCLIEYSVMCFGLRNGAQTYQYLINDMLQDFDFAFTYIDDVLTASHTEQEHEHHIRMVLERCQDYGAAINPEKCIFAVDSLFFLGYTITKDACRPNPDRVAAINDWPLPTNKKSLQRFLDTINFYRHFIPNAEEVGTTLLLNHSGQKTRSRRPMPRVQHSTSAVQHCPPPPRLHIQSLTFNSISAQIPLLLQLVLC